MPILKEVLLRALSPYDAQNLAIDEESPERLVLTRDTTVECPITKHISQGSSIRTPYISATKVPYSALRYAWYNAEQQGIAIFGSSLNQENIAYDAASGNTAVKLDSYAKKFAPIDAEVVLRHRAVVDARGTLPTETFANLRNNLTDVLEEGKCTQLQFYNALHLSPVKVHRVFAEASFMDALGEPVVLPASEGESATVAQRACRTLRRELADWFGTAGAPEEQAAAPPLAAAADATGGDSNEVEDEDVADGEVPRLGICINKLGEGECKYHRFYCPAARKVLESRDQLGGKVGEGAVLLPGHEWNRLGGARLTIRACVHCKKIANKRDEAADKMIARHVPAAWLV